MVILRYSPSKVQGTLHLAVLIVHQVRWLCRPPHPRQRDTVAHIVREETRKCRLSVAWIMGGLHSEATTRWVRTETGAVREMADDDKHVTVLEQVAAGWRGEKKPTAVAKRLMSENERTYVGGQPSHIWVWGSYEPISQEWPRKGPVLPVHPFVRKPQYEYLDEQPQQELRSYFYQEATRA
ncbi:hypothetical protein TruAng_009678 [Truncatella angustata]|nr:hypothetical protein TruAng_009678 [Truncatella angustata]